MYGRITLTQWLGLHGLRWALQEAGQAGAYHWCTTGQMSYKLPTGNSGNESSNCELVKCDLLIHMRIFKDQPIQSTDYSIHPPPAVWPHLFCGAGHKKRRREQKWYSNSLNCIMLVETTHLTQVE